METALEEIQFLANSANRVRVLNRLTTGPASRRELEEETGVARSTTARILNEAEDQGWVASTGSEYQITSAGEVLVSEFSTYVETVEGVRHLGEAIDWLPDPIHELDFRYFRHADITTPTEDNPTAMFDRGLERIRTADKYRGLTQNSIPEYMKTIRDRVNRDQLDFQGIIEASFLEELRDDPDRAARWHDIAHGMWLYNGQIPINMHLIDGKVLVWLCDENGAGDDIVMRGLLESEHPAVVSWAETLYEEYREEAESLDPSTLPEV